MLLDDWTSAAMVVSHLAPAHPPSISPGSKQSHQVANNLTGQAANTNLQQTEISPTAVYPRRCTQVAHKRHKSHSACSHQFYYNANTMMSASWLVPVSLFPGWLRHAATYSEASSLPRLIRSHRVPTRPP